MGQPLERRKINGFEVNFKTSTQPNPVRQQNFTRNPNQRPKENSSHGRPHSFVGNR